MKILHVLVLFLCVPQAFADERDDAMFGDPAPATAPPGSPPAASPSATNAAPALDRSALEDKFKVGGRLDFSENFSLGEDQKIGKATLQFRTRTDVYFDAEPNERSRAFIRLRLTTPVTDPAVRTNAQLQLDESWLRWNASNQVFFTLGRQHLKWGSARFWNPTDFMASEILDPFATFDARLGSDLFKIHVPFEGAGHNVYLVVKTENGNKVEDLAAALRAEIVMFTSELSLTTAWRSQGRVSLGADLSAGVGPFDVYSENAWTRSPQRIRYSGEFAPSEFRFPTGELDGKKFIGQHVVGLNSTVNISDTDSFTLGAEYFENGLGADNAGLEFYSFLNGEGKPLYLARRYVAGYARLPQPGNWNDTSVILSGVKNIVDGSTQATAIVTNEIFPRVSAELSFSRCFGGPGDLCFALPENLRGAALSPNLSEGVRNSLAALPSSRPIVNAGLGLVATF